MVSFSDPIKPSTMQAAADAKRLGVKIKMLTGDSLEVARAVGEEIGLIRKGHGAITGKDFEEMGYEDKRTAVRQNGVFARVSPKQKFEIIKILQEKYEVGYLGEGINDAPAA